MTTDPKEVIAGLRADVDTVIARIGGELPAGGEDEWRRTLLALLDGIAERRLPSADELAFHRDWGRRLAERAVPASTVINGYQIVVREAWAHLSGRARAAGTDADLINRANLCWAWTAALSAAAIQGRAEPPSYLALGARFVDALFAGEPPAEMARQLGFDPDGTFQVVCSRSASEPQAADALYERLRRGPVAVSVRPGLVVVVFQGTEASDILAALGPTYRQGVGLGLARAGLKGAAESLTDAEAALRLSIARGRPVSFEDEWMPIILMLDADRLETLVANSVGAPAHLEEAVAMWAYSDFSIPAAAKKLHIHPNTLKYRLDRWREVTGWDPRSRPDLELTLLHHNLNTVQGRGEHRAGPRPPRSDADS